MTRERDQLIESIARAVPGATLTAGIDWDVVDLLGDRAVLVEDTVDDAGNTFVVSGITIFGDADWEFSSGPDMANAERSLVLAREWLTGPTPEEEDS